MLLWKGCGERRKKEWPWASLWSWIYFLFLLMKLLHCTSFLDFIKGGIRLQLPYFQHRVNAQLRLSIHAPFFEIISLGMMESGHPSTVVLTQKQTPIDPVCSIYSLLPLTHFPHVPSSCHITPLHLSISPLALTSFTPSCPHAKQKHVLALKNSHSYTVLAGD